MLGLSRKQARERFDHILAFAELEEFVDLKLKNYSSGMYVRLAFATAVQVDADILLIDEVLAVGDAAFQQKCFDEFTRLREAGRTILFVTHDMGAVERYCDRAMLLESGRVVDIGEPSAIARQYNKLNFHHIRQEARASTEAPETSDDAPVAEVVTARFESLDGEITVSAQQGEQCNVQMQVLFHQELDNPIFAIALLSEAGHTSFATNTDARRIPTGSYTAGSTASIRLRFDNWLAPGRYRLVARVIRAGPGADVLDEHSANTILVLPDRPGGGMTDLPHSFELTRP
jgi:ABC-type multidrug transport system ATPase subunit